MHGVPRDSGVSAAPGQDKIWLQLCLKPPTLPTFWLPCLGWSGQFPHQFQAGCHQLGPGTHCGSLGCPETTTPGLSSRHHLLSNLAARGVKLLAPLPLSVERGKNIELPFSIC